MVKFVCRLNLVFDTNECQEKVLFFLFGINLFSGREATLNTNVSKVLVSSVVWSVGLVGRCCRV